MVGIDAAFGSSMMVLRTSRAPRVHAGHVGDRRVRNRASPLCALNAVRTAASVDAGVTSTSGARVAAAVAFPGARAAVSICFAGAWSGADFLESHPSSSVAAATASIWIRMLPA